MLSLYLFDIITTISLTIIIIRIRPTRTRISTSGNTHSVLYVNICVYVNTCSCHVYNVFV